MHQILYQQNIPNISPSRSSYGVPFVKIRVKLDLVITAPHCSKPTTCIAHWMRRQKTRGSKTCLYKHKLLETKKNRLPSCLDGCRSKLQMLNDSRQERCINWSVDFMLTNPNDTKSGLSLWTSAAKFLKISFGHAQWRFRVNKKYTK